MQTESASGAYPPSDGQQRSVESIQFRVHWPYGNINHYLESMVQKYLRKQRGVIATFFPGIGKDRFKIDYDPALISAKELATILECFQLQVEQI